MHPTTDRLFTCVSCEGQIVGNVEFHVGLPFCCAGCVAGGPCTCSYDVDQLPAATDTPVADVRVEVLV
jgi:hypothetical protein